jgi:hypothetical protein
MRDDINKKRGGQHKHEAMGWPKKCVLKRFTCKHRSIGTRR